MILRLSLVSPRRFLKKKKINNFRVRSQFAQFNFCQLMNVTVDWNEWRRQHKLNFEALTMDNFNRIEFGAFYWFFGRMENLKRVRLDVDGDTDYDDDDDGEWNVHDPLRMLSSCLPSIVGGFVSANTK